MLENISAVYEKGCLRPLQPLNLHENEIVHIRVLPATTSNENESDEIIQIMVNANFMRPLQFTRNFISDPVSEEERIEIAKKLGRVKGKPLSEIIIEERDQ